MQTCDLFTVTGRRCKLCIHLIILLWYGFRLYLMHGCRLPEPGQNWSHSEDEQAETFLLTQSNRTDLNWKQTQWKWFRVKVDSYKSVQSFRSALPQANAPPPLLSCSWADPCHSWRNGRETDQSCLHVNPLWKTLNFFWVSSKTAEFTGLGFKAWGHGSSSGYLSLFLSGWKCTSLLCCHKLYWIFTPERVKWK